MEHIKHAADLGFLVARARFAATHPEEEAIHKWWTDLPEEKKATIQDLTLILSGGKPISEYSNG